MSEKDFLLNFYKNIVKSFFQYILGQIKEEITSKTLNLHLSSYKFSQILSLNNVKNEKNKKNEVETEETKNDTVEDKSKDINIFETNNFYNMFYEEFKKINDVYKEVEFNSFYSLLSFIRTVDYINILIDSNVNIFENKKFKVFLYILLLFFKGNKESQKNLGLNEALFVGTFEELNKLYPQYKYKDSNKLKTIINNWKESAKEILYNLCNYIFNKIYELIKLYGDLNDRAIQGMKTEVLDILNIQTNIITEELIEKITNFYNNDEYLILINYCSEKKYEGEDIKIKINSSFLKNKENFKYKELNNQFILNDINSDLNTYITLKNKYLETIELLLPKIFINIGLDNEILISSLLEPYDITNNCSMFYKKYEDIKNNIDNLNNSEIEKEIEDILKEDEIYELFFRILETNYVKTFFTNIIYLGENDDEYQFLSSYEKDSEIYEKFLKKYNRNYEKFKDFKELIIIKTLSKGDRAYVIPKLKKYVINPSQFLVGNKIKEYKTQIKTILKGYLIVILLHETEHFLRLLNEKNVVSNNTPRKKEGGELFIKYLFGVKTISNISFNQAERIIDLENWNNPEKIKNIFKDQQEEVIYDEYITYNYPDSISFYSTKKIINLYFNGNNNDYLPLKK